MSEFDDFVKAAQGGAPAKVDSGGSDFEEFQKAVRFGNSQPNTLSLTAGPVVMDSLPAGGTIGMKDVGSSSDLPFMMQLRLQYGRQNPQDLAKVLNSEGFSLEPPVDGRLIAKGPDGKRYAIDETMPGPAAIQYGPKMALYGALAANPEAGIPAFLARSALGSLAGTGEEIASRKALGLSSGTTPGQVAEETTGNVILDSLFRGAGSLFRGLTGAGRARTAYDATLAQATAENTVKQAEITAKMQQAQTATDLFKKQAMEREALKIGKENVRGDFAQALGVSLDDLEKLKEQDLPGLAARTGRVKTIFGDAGRKVTGRISADYEQLLSPYAKEPVDPSGFRGAAKEARNWMAERGYEPSATLDGLLQDVESMGPRPSLEPFGTKVPASSPEGLARMGQISGRLQLEKALARGEPLPEATVERVRSVVSQLRGFAANTRNAIDAKMANQTADAIGESIAQVVPDDVRASLKGLDSQWYEANKLLSRDFKATVRNSSNPAEVADAVLGSSADRALGGVERTHTLLNEIQDSEMPAVRGAIIERILRAPSPDKYANSIDPSIMRRIFTGTGAEDPKKLSAAIAGAYKLETLIQDPAYMKRLGDAAEASFQTALGQKRMASIQAIRDGAMADAAALVDPTQQARDAAAKAAQKTPGFLRWLGHHAAYRGGLALLGAGYALHSEPLYLAAPFLLGRAGLEHALSDPKLSKLYLNMVLSPTVEKQGFLLGRLAASAASEYGKNAIRNVRTMSVLERPAVSIGTQESE